MKDFRSRKKRHPFLLSPLFMVILFLLVILFVKSAYSSFQKKTRAQKEEDKYTQEYKKLLEKKEELTKTIEKLNTESGVLEELKKTFNIAQDGETIIHIVEPKK